MTMRLAGINLHPVKSTAIRPVETAYVGRVGLRGDREWMVVDDAGALVTARDTPRLFRVVADNAATGLDHGVDLRLSAPHVDPLDVAIPTEEGAEVDVRFFGGTLRARPVGGAADAWLRQALARDDLRLVWCHEPEARVVEGPGLADDHHAVFQDDSPVSLLSDASVAALNAWTEPDVPEIPARRFRANLLVDGAESAFAEDEWSVLTIGGARLRVVVPIARCSMTTIDPDTLTTGKEPIRTLARHRKWNGQTWFAVHLVVEEPGEIAVGDELTLG